MRRSLPHLAISLLLIAAFLAFLWIQAGKEVEAVEHELMIEAMP